MKRLLLLMLVFLSGCTTDKTHIVELGALDSPQIWIYLCGLTQDFDSSEEIQNRKNFDLMGKALHIKFIAIKPPTRCATFDNKLCWPHDNATQTLDTYQYIVNSTNNQPIAGFIGFSNGGFFLNTLAQVVELKKPIISIGSAGYLHNAKIGNTIHLMISKNDTFHYTHAHAFYRQAHNSCLNIKLIEYAGGHIIPFETLQQLLQQKPLL